MQEEKGLQELAEQVVYEGKRISRTVTRGEPRSYQFTPDFIKALAREHELLRDSGITVDKILRGLEYRIYDLEQKYKEYKEKYSSKYGSKYGGSGVVDRQQKLAPDEVAILKNRPTIKV